jgi:NADP-dependent 3-hydroxy acid dehydrogenase YdfG
MVQQIALVTGASSGIGAAIAQHLAQAGLYVYATARRLDRLQALRTANIEPLQLDVTSPESVKAAIDHILQHSGRVDVLVNNAGYGQWGAFEDVSDADARRQFDVNVFGLADITRAVLPIMRQQHAGRIINITSVAGKLSVPIVGWYSASKHAVEALSDALRGEVRPFGIHIAIIEPGSIKTEFDTVAHDALRKVSGNGPYKTLAERYSRMVSRFYRTAPGPEVIARAVHHAVTARRPRTRYALPLDSRATILIRRLAGDRMVDRIILAMMR